MKEETAEESFLESEMTVLAGDELDAIFKRAQKYRKLPVIISAIKVNHTVKIHTLEGVMTASPGDYIIKGVKGEFYPCKPDIFEQTYAVTNSAETTNEQRKTETTRPWNDDLREG